MAADDTAVSGDRSEEEEEALETPPPTYVEVYGDLEAATAATATHDAPSPSGNSTEDTGGVKKLTCSVIYLCFYGFMTSIRPGEAFITPNMLSSEKNLTREQVSNVCKILKRPVHNV